MYYFTTRSFNDNYFYPSTFDSLSRLFGESNMWQEHESHYQLSIDLPGVTKDQLKLTQKEDVLYLEAKRRIGGREESSTHFKQMISIPTGARPDSLEANLDHGVLSLIFEKREAAKAKEIEITSEGPLYKKVLSHFKS